MEIPEELLTETIMVPENCGECSASCQLKKMGCPYDRAMAIDGATKSLQGILESEKSGASEYVQYPQAVLEALNADAKACRMKIVSAAGKHNELVHTAAIVEKMMAARNGLTNGATKPVESKKQVAPVFVDSSTPEPEIEVPQIPSDVSAQPVPELEPEIEESVEETESLPEPVTEDNKYLEPWMRETHDELRAECKDPESGLTYFRQARKSITDYKDFKKEMEAMYNGPEYGGLRSTIIVKHKNGKDVALTFYYYEKPSTQSVDSEEE